AAQRFPLPASAKKGSLAIPQVSSESAEMSAQPAINDVSKEKLVADLKVVVADAEELLRATASQAGEKVAAARERIQASFAIAKVKLTDAERALLEKTKETAKAAD